MKTAMTREELAALMSGDPRCAQLFIDLAAGKSPWASYVSIFGPELKDGLDNPDTIEQIRQAETAYAERVARNRQLDEEYEANIEASIETLKEFQAQRGMSDDETDAVLSVLLGIVRDGLVGRFAPETLDMMAKAISHDADVAAAAEEGKLAGRNERIVEHMRQAYAGDGVAALGGRNSAPSTRRGDTLFDLAMQACD